MILAITREGKYVCYHPKSNLLQPGSLGPQNKPLGKGNDFLTQQQMP